jgi:hypothetical protein
MTLTRSLAVALALSAVLAAPGAAQTSVDKTVPFELDKWHELNAKEGPITLHRIRLEKQGGVPLKNRVTGGDDEFRVGIKVEIEYTNASSTEWRAISRITWVDDRGELIDGFNGSNELEEKKDFDRVGGTVVTLKYGLAHARRLRLLINARPD